MPSKIIISVLEWVVTVVILMAAEKAVKITWRALKTLKDARTIPVIAEK